MASVMRLQLQSDFEGGSKETADNNNLNLHHHKTYHVGSLIVFDGQITILTPFLCGFQHFDVPRGRLSVPLITIPYRLPALTRTRPHHFLQPSSCNMERLPSSTRRQPITADNIACPYKGCPVDLSLSIPPCLDYASLPCVAKSNPAGTSLVF
jgi:hypothetical protein